MENGKFKFLDKAIHQGISVTPRHTDKQFRSENQSFISIDADSLNRLTVDSLNMEIEIVANNEVRTATFETGKKFDGNYLKDFFVEEIFENDFQAEKFVSGTNPRIKTLETKILNLEEEERFVRNGFQQLETAKYQLEVDLEKEKDLYQREKLLKRIEEVEKEMDKAFDNSGKVKELKSQILELRAADRIKNQEKRLEVERKNREGEEEPTRLSGVVRFLIIQ